MNIYGDESGSIDNVHYHDIPYFVICLIRVINKASLKRSFKRFVASNLDELKRLDGLKPEPKMFKDGKFVELKGSYFDRAMKKKFVSYFIRKPDFQVFFISADNSQLTSQFCANSARAFNYLVCKNFDCLLSKGILPDEACLLQLDERNEKTETKFFLENYLNTELVLRNLCTHEFHVMYFDSSQNCLIQLADVFANILYSQCITKAYKCEFEALEETRILGFNFTFPYNSG